MSAREELLSQARKHLWAAWALSQEEIGSQAAATLLGLGMLVPEGGAQELEKLRARVVELEEQLAALQAQQEVLRGADGITRLAVPVQVLREDDPFHLRHDYRVSRDLPETGGTR